jgi:hypothetical protein
MEMTILYEDADVVAIDKPSGVMTHPDGHEREGEIEIASDWFAEHYPGSKDVGETQRLQDGTEIIRPGVVHRRRTRSSRRNFKTAKYTKHISLLRTEFQKSEKELSNFP